MALAISALISVAYAVLSFDLGSLDLDKTKKSSTILIANLAIAALHGSYKFTAGPSRHRARWFRIEFPPSHAPLFTIQGVLGFLSWFWRAIEQEPQTRTLLTTTVHVAIRWTFSVMFHRHGKNTIIY